MRVGVSSLENYTYRGPKKNMIEIDAEIKLPPHTRNPGARKSF
jgi:hypothetical protein